MGSGHGQVAGSVQTVLRHSHKSSRVCLEASGAPHRKAGGLVLCVGGASRGKADDLSPAFILSVLAQRNRKRGWGVRLILLFPSVLMDE